MKTTFTTQHNAASTLNGSHAAHNVYSPLRRLTLLVTLLMTFALGARAADYTISNGNNYLGINNNGTLTNINPYNATNCVWTGPESGSGRFSMTVNGTTYYLRRENSGSLTVTEYQDYATSWTINGDRLYCKPYNSNYYINYNNGWSTNRNSGNGTLAKVTYKDPTGITAEGVEILVGEEGQITYELTSTSGTPVYDNVTFSIDNTGIATINATTGVVTGVSAGTATVTVTAKKQDGTTARTATCSVVVKEPVTLEYVFYYNGYYLAINDNGTDIEPVAEFDPETCIWRGVETGTGVYSATVDGTTYYLQLPSNYDFAITTNINQATQWTRNENKLYSTGNRYVRYNNGWTTTSYSGYLDTEVLYPITKTSDGNPTSTITYTVGATSVSPTAATLDFANAKTAQFTADADVTKTTTTTKTATYQHSSSGGSTITPSSTVREVASEPLSPTGYDWSLSSTDNLTLGTGTASTNSVTYSTASGTTKNVTLNVTAYYMDGTSKKQGTAGTATITVNEKKDDPTGITAEDLSLAVDEQKSISYTLTPSNAYDNIDYSRYDNSIISITDGMVKGLKAGITIVTLIAKNLNGTDSAHSATSTVTVTPKAPTIEFSLGANITATISTTETGAKIYYTIDGSTPTTSSTEYTDTAPVSVAAGTTIKAIVVVTANGTPLTSPVAEALANAESGIVGNTVYLYDLEDHNWTYYQSSNLPTGYPTSYLSSPNPRNVKITYNGVNEVSGSSTNVKVSISESENSFVYYKTLEQGSTSGEYPYQVISNPFSVRPSTGSGNSKVYYGFAGWKIKSGGDYIKNYDNDDILPLDAEIIFEKLPYSSVNCISAEIVLETTWTKANVQTGNNISTMLSQFSGGTYETNFAVLTGSYTTAWTGNKNATITSVYPDGSTDSRNGVSTRLNLTLNDGYTIKYEYIHINNSSSTFTMGSGTKMLYLGRGISNTTAGNSCCNLLQGCSGSVDNGLTYTLKIESGIYGNISYTRGLNSSQNATIEGTVDIKSILGCDYDRAKKDNEKLKFTDEMWVGDGPTLADSKSGQTIWRCTVKSGTMNSSLTSAGNGDAQRSFYVGIGANYSPGHRRLEVEGGLFWSIAGGLDKNNNTDPCITYRIRGGTFRGAIYGSAANASAYGIKQMIFTGGEIQGWIGAGANGTSNNGGKTDGTSYVYIGGKTRLVGNNETLINGSVGGSVFGAGSGSPDYTAGEMTLGSNVVVADEAYIVKNVYGGGNYGFTDNQANIFITGGTVDGGVFGGANQNKGDYTNVVMTGGLVKGGIYGGSNTSGTIGYNVTMQINGGQVGTPSAPANIHGGGYGQSTIVTGNVNLSLGTSDQTSEGVTVWGDVYGGSALGKVNCTVNNYNNYQYTNNTETNVTLYKGTINGSLYGGALGGSNVGTHVYGPVKVKVYGGSVKKTSADGSGGVYGANNKDGAPQRSVTVDIYGTDPAPAENQYALHAVYGGGNQASYNGTPIVTVHNCDNSIEYVYGGGNAAAVAATDVTIYGGNTIGNVFGGGNGTVSAANVTGATSTKIYGGTILNVYGGSNSQGTIGGDISVLVDSQGEGEKEPCTMNIGSVYGGGNLAASKSGNISIYCTGKNGYIENVFGGANQANITGNIDLRIDGGNIGNVFGGNNNSGDINGTITVTVGNAPNYCGVFRIGNVYGGGNLAAYSAPTGNLNFPMVNIKGGTVLNAVYGGGLGGSAVVRGNPRVNVSGGIVGNKTTMVGATMITGDVFGGGSQAALTGNAIVTLSDNANVYNCVYGGGLGESAKVTGNPQVTMTGGTVGYAETVDGKQVVSGGDVFGGGNAAAVQGNTNVQISGGEVKRNVYGGGNQAKVTGKTNVVIGE